MAYFIFLPCFSLWVTFFELNIKTKLIRYPIAERTRIFQFQFKQEDVEVGVGFEPRHGKSCQHGKKEKSEDSYDLNARISEKWVQIAN